MLPDARREQPELLGVHRLYHLHFVQGLLVQLAGGPAGHVHVAQEVRMRVPALSGLLWRRPLRVELREVLRPRQRLGNGAGAAAAAAASAAAPSWRNFGSTYP